MMALTHTILGPRRYRVHNFSAELVLAYRRAFCSNYCLQLLRP